MALRFKLDENIPARALRELHRLGHDAETAEAEGLAGAIDPTVLDACRSENRLLVTLDLDFANIRDYPPGTHKGIWVLRPGQQTIDAIMSLLAAGLRLSEIEPSDGRLWVIDAHRVRIRD